MSWHSPITMIYHSSSHYMRHKVDHITSNINAILVRLWSTVDIEKNIQNCAGTNDTQPDDFNGFVILSACDRFLLKFFTPLFVVFRCLLTGK